MCKLSATAKRTVPAVVEISDVTTEISVETVFVDDSVVVLVDTDGETVVTPPVTPRHEHALEYLA